jgi:hypothetical protein
MLSREEILSAYKEVNFPEKLFDSSIKDIKNVIFFEKSTQPSSAKEKDTKQLSQSYVLPWRLVQKNYPDANNNKNTFNRGVNFAPKEPLVEIKVENFKLMHDKFSIPIETGVIYLKNNYGGIIGPFNLDQLHNMYKNKKVDSTFEFRTIDIFSFKDSDLFSFQSIKIINDEKWIDSLIDSPLLKYSELSKNKKEEKKEVKKEETKKEEPKKEESKNESGDDRVCRECGEKGHISYHCPKAKCYNCGQYGHKSFDCRKKRGYQRGGRGGYRSGYGGGGYGKYRESNTKCYNCGKYGHRSYDCDKPNGKNCYICGKPGHISNDCPENK